MNNKQLYEKIMRNISKQVKNALNEDIQKFDTSDYQENDDDIINNQDIENITNTYNLLSNTINKAFKKANRDIRNKAFKKVNRDIRRGEDAYNYRLDGDFLSPYNDMYIEYGLLGYIPRGLRVSKKDVKNLEKQISDYLTEDYMYDAEFMNLYNDFAFKKNILVDIVNNSKGELIYVDKADIHFYIIKEGNTAVIYGIFENRYDMEKTKPKKAECICFVIIATKDVQFSY